jgi:DNA-binding response OmpR family regulator
VIDIILNQLKNYTLLFVENEKIIRENFEEFFNLLFKEVFVAIDGVEALKLYKLHKPDLIITDIKMPNMNGIELVSRIRKKDKKTSIVVISAHTDQEFLLSSIPLNLIEYIVKPLTQEKLYNIFYLFMKNQTIPKIPNFIFNEEKNQIIVNEKIFELSLKENKFLSKIINNSNRVVSYEEIEEDIWNDKSMSQNALRLFIKNLRKKLPKNFIRNVSNQGYILNSI